jgi:hypothetical protein
MDWTGEPSDATDGTLETNENCGNAILVRLRYADGYVLITSSDKCAAFSVEEAAGPSELFAVGENRTVWYAGSDGTPFGVSSEGFARPHGESIDRLR